MRDEVRAVEIWILSSAGNLKSCLQLHHCLLKSKTNKSSGFIFPWNVAMLPLMVCHAPEQAFMEGAGDNGVLLVAMGTVATLGTPISCAALFMSLFVATPVQKHVRLKTETLSSAAFRN